MKNSKFLQGMLWFDNDPKTSLDQKIDNAKKYYQKKYCDEENHCMRVEVNPKIGKTHKMSRDFPRLKMILEWMFGIHHFYIENVRVTESHTILPNYVWIVCVDSDLHGVRN